jgi:FG-GAP repeat
VVVLAGALLTAIPIFVSEPAAAVADPLVEQTELIGHGAGFGGSGNIGGHSVALSADGDTALVGAPAGSSEEPSYAQIYTRSGAAWSQPTTLVPVIESVERVPQDGFGAGVALSANGSTAIVGDTYDGAYAFTKEGSAWRSTALEPTGEAEAECSGRFGEAVAVSEDGNTAIVGSPYGCPEDFDGSAWIYSRSGSTWSLQAGPLHGEEKIDPFGNSDRFGSSVALSGDGNTALVAAPGEDAAVGAAWVYKRSGSTWSQDGPKLNPPGEGADANFGRSVALSGDGSLALIGVSGENNEGSGAWIFGRGSAGWAPQTRLSSGEDIAVNGSIGWTVALSRSGNTALIGGPETSPEEAGKAWVFKCAPTGWVREAVQPPVSVPYGNFGYSVALSGDGATALIGANGVPGQPHPTGAAFVFTGSPDPSGFCATNGIPTANAGGGGSHGGGKATGAPVVESLQQTHRTWREGRALASLARRHSRTAVGTTFEFSLNEPSRVRFSFTQPSAGHVVHGRCTRSPSHARHPRRCRLAVSRGVLTLSAGAGARRLRFDGRISKRDRLPTGDYTLTLTAEAAGMRSASRHLSFRIVA